MSVSPRGLNTLRGALVSISPNTPVPSIIAFQYNPATLRRTLQPEMVGGEEGERSQAVRFKGAPETTITVEIELDASDLLEKNDATTLQYGLQPQLAALELLVYPTSSTITQRAALLSAGTLEIAPMTAPRILFVWGSHRVLPVRLQTYTIQETQFDTNLNPLNATIELSMRVLNYEDLSSSNPGYYEFLTYQQGQESLSNSAPSATSSILGIQYSQLN